MRCFVVVLALALTSCTISIDASDPVSGRIYKATLSWSPPITGQEGVVRVNKTK